jgi:hypothetical protein
LSSIVQDVMAALCTAALWLGLMGLPALAADGVPRATSGIEEAACRIVESAAHASRVPVDMLTRLVWQESRFRADAISPKGAQGMAQFMPDTAAERGLRNPFDPEQAIPKAAQLLADLGRQFGNLGLAAAAYNAGAARVADWLQGTGSLPAETQTYVLLVTGRSAEDWAVDKQRARATAPASGQTCLDITAALRTEEGASSTPIAPWGVQLAGNFSKPLALSSFERARQRYARIIGDLQPMIIGTVLRSRGTRPFYRVLLPAASRAQADQLCNAILAGGGACAALRS